MRVSFPSVLPVSEQPARQSFPQFAAVTKPDSVHFEGAKSPGIPFGVAILDAVWDQDLDAVQRSATPETINATTYQGKNTSLHLAAMRGNVKIVKFLLSQPGIQLHKQNAYQETPQQIAERYALPDAEYRKLRGASSGVSHTHRQEYQEIVDLIKAAARGVLPQPPTPPAAPSTLDQLAEAARSGNSLKVLALVSRVLSEGTEEEKAKLLKKLQGD